MNFATTRRFLQQGAFLTQSQVVARKPLHVPADALVG